MLGSYRSAPTYVKTVVWKRFECPRLRSPKVLAKLCTPKFYRVGHGTILAPLDSNVKSAIEGSGRIEINLAA